MQTNIRNIRALLRPEIPKGWKLQVKLTPVLDYTGMYYNPETKVLQAKCWYHTNLPIGWYSYNEQDLFLLGANITSLVSVDTRTYKARWKLPGENGLIATGFIARKFDPLHTLLVFKSDEEEALETLRKEYASFQEENQ